MGNVWYTYVSHPDTAPDYKNPPTFDPMLGFPNGRKERTIKSTREMLDKANVPLDKRDYCVDHFMAVMNCRRENYPWIKTNCSHLIHDWANCEKDDDTLRVKEYEREKRLKERAKRKLAKENCEALIE